MKTYMMNRVSKVFDYIFKRDPNLQKFPLRIVRTDVNVDTDLEKIFLSHYLSRPPSKTQRYITSIIRPSPKKGGK